jgi:hypothetical protein
VFADDLALPLFHSLATDLADVDPFLRRGRARLSVSIWLVHGGSIAPALRGSQRETCRTLDGMTIEEALRHTLAEATEGRVAFPRDLQGFPGTVHGGAVAALFYRVTTPRPPARIRLDLLRGVPTDTPLRLTTGSSGAVARVGLAHEERRLAEAELARLDPVPPVDAAPLLAAWRARVGEETALPRTTTCLACGSANPLGLALTLRTTSRFLWCEVEPPEHYRAANGLLHPALATVGLDELGWWLGALAQGECGVTTEVVVTVLRPLPFARVLLVADRDAMQADDDPRGRYVRARTWLLAADGSPLALADVRFAGSPAYTKRLLQPFLETTSAESFFRIFPRARALAARSAIPPA